MAEIALSRLSEDEHSIQLRRAVVASTIGTAIEWYDFFLYSTVTGLAFASCSFPSRIRWSARGGLSLIPHDIMYGPQAALIAELFPGRLRYSGASLGYQLASIIAGGPAPLIATALFAAYHSGYAISIYIAACTVVSLVSAAFMPDYTGKDISREYDQAA